MFFDNHTHSTFSPDARTTVMESIEFASTHGLSGVAFTDHLDLDAPARDCEFKFSIKEQQSEIDRCANIYAERLERLGNGYCRGAGNRDDKGTRNTFCREEKKNKLQIFKGIEVGLQYDSIDKIRDYLKGFCFDVVIGSVHFVEHLDPYMQTYYEGKDYKRAYNGALEAICKTAFEYRDFDILGHFDYITRYRDYPCRTITLKEFGDYLEPLLRFLAETGKALEVNTNTYKERFGGTPALDINILKRFRELGGEALSFGSDAHDAFRLGEAFEYFAQMVKKCGFTHLAYYKDRKPHFYKI